MRLADEPEARAHQTAHHGAGKRDSQHTQLHADRARQRRALAPAGSYSLRLQAPSARHGRHRSRVGCDARPRGRREGAACSRLARLKRTFMAGANKKRELDFTDFPPGTVTEYTTHLCLACTFDIFTAQLGLEPRTAYSEITCYTPTIQELTAPQAARPFFDSTEKHPRCPYCDATKRWHARFDTTRIEGGKTTDAPRRALLKSLPKADEQFQAIETKSDRRTLFFGWLDPLGRPPD